MCLTCDIYGSINMTYGSFSRLRKGPPSERGRGIGAEVWSHGGGGQDIRRTIRCVHKTSVSICSRGPCPTSSSTRSRTEGCVHGEIARRVGSRTAAVRQLERANAQRSRITSVGDVSPQGQTSWCRLKTREGSLRNSVLTGCRLESYRRPTKFSSPTNYGN